MDSGPSDLVEFDLETMEPIVNTRNILQASDIIDEIPFLILPVQLMISIREMHLILILQKITTTTKCPLTVKMKICRHTLSII